MPPSRYFPAIVIPLLLLFAAACGSPDDEVGETEEGRLVLGQTEERRMVERGIAPGGRVVVLEGNHGDIYLDVARDRYVSLEFEKIARGSDSEAARRLLDQLSISEEGTDAEYFYRVSSPDEQRTSVNVRGSVPEQVSLRISWSSGTISLSGPDGPLQITNGSGAVEAAGIAGDTEIRVNNGGILAGVERLPDDAEIVLATANGDITVSLPVETSARVAAETGAGAIQTTGLQFEDRHLEPIGAGSAFEGRLGRGNARIRISTENGTIHLMQGRMERLAPSDTLVMPSDTLAMPADTAGAAADTADVDAGPADTTAASRRASDTLRGL